MANVTYKRTGELIRELFTILMRSPEGMRASKALEELENKMTLSAYEAGNYESGGRRFEKIVRFATVDCVKAGWLEKNKGVWIVTEEGGQAFSQYPEPEVFYRKASELYRKWKNEQPDQQTSRSGIEAVSRASSEESISITYEEAEEQAWMEVEQFLKAMDPFEFQKLVADLLQAMGYFVSWVSPPGKDMGVDIIAHPDPLGTKAPRIKAQVKRHAEIKIARPEIQSFLSTISDDDAGIFICTSGFTRDAEEFARSQERRKIMLIDLNRFFELWVQFYTKLDDMARRRFPVSPIYFLTPEH